MEPRCLLDSNVIIDYLTGKLPASGMQTVLAIVDQIPNISVISQIDDFKNITDLKKQKVTVTFFEKYNPYMKVLFSNSPTPYSPKPSPHLQQKVLHGFDGRQGHAR